MADRFNVYSNRVGISSNIFDIQMAFFRRDSFEETETIKKGEIYEGEHQVSVTMSIQHAKAFIAMLNEHIAGYEKEFGEIKLNSTKED